MGFKFGDIVENGWAGDTNPIKRLIFIKFGHRSGRLNHGKHFVSMGLDGRKSEHPVEGNRMTVVGSIFQCDNIGECRELLAARDGEGG